MKRKIFSKLLMGALLIASVSSFVSCKDYDDDIDNLQKQIDAAALKAELTNLQTTLASQIAAAQAAADNAAKAAAAAQKTADAAATAAALDAVKAAATQAGTDAAKALTDAANAQKAADAAAAAAEAAKYDDTAVKAAAAGAQATADNAVAAAGKAQEAADAAQKAADEAKAAAAAAKYDDAALKAAVEKAQKAADDAAKAAQAAQDKADAAAADAASKATAKDIEDAITKATEAINAATDAKISAAVAKAIADLTAKIPADQSEAIASLTSKLNTLATNQAEAATAEALQTAVTELEGKIAAAAAASGDAAAVAATISEVSAATGTLKTSVEALYTAVSHVELIGTYTGSGNNFWFDNRFGANISEALIEMNAAKEDLDAKKAAYRASTDPEANTVVADFDYYGYFRTRPASYYNSSAPGHDEFLAFYAAYYTYQNAQSTYDYYKYGTTASVRNFYLDFQHGKVAYNYTFGEGENVVPFAADETKTYQAGKDIVFNSYLTVRVSPANADLSKAKVILVNSLGEGLDDIVVAGTPVRSQTLITRGTNISAGSNIWTIPFTIAEGKTEQDFDKAVRTSTGSQILFAVAVNNTQGDESDDRYVTSSYDVQPRYYAYTPANAFAFMVGNKYANQVGNRWDASTPQAKSQNEPAHPNASAYEFEWLQSKKNFVTPNTQIIKGNSTSNSNVRNAQANQYDDRWDVDPYPAVLGETFTVSLTDTWRDGGSYPSWLRGYVSQIEWYYVTLDKEMNAVESTPSEWNAWKGYVDGIEGINKMTRAGEPLDITINKATADKDIIGFRIFAINYDGSLADPDGRAFYVQIGDPANRLAVEGNWIADLQYYSNIYSVVNMKDAKNNKYENLIAVDGSKFSNEGTFNPTGSVYVSSAANANVLKYDDLVRYTFLKSDKKTPAGKWTEVAYMAYAVRSADYWVDGGTATFTITSNTASGHLANSLTVSLTKKLTAAYKEPEWRATMGPVNGVLTVYPSPSDRTPSYNANTKTQTIGTGINPTGVNIVWPTKAVLPASNVKSAVVDLAGYANNLNATIYDWTIKSVKKANGDKAADILIVGGQTLSGTTYHNFLVAVNTGNIGSTFDSQISATYPSIKLEKVDGNATDHTVTAWEGKVKFASLFEPSNGIVAYTNSSYNYWEKQTAAAKRKWASDFYYFYDEPAFSGNKPLFALFDANTISSAETALVRKYGKVEDLNTTSGNGNATFGNVYGYNLNALMKADWSTKNKKADQNDAEAKQTAKMIAKNSGLGVDNPSFELLDYITFGNTATISAAAKTVLKATVASDKITFQNIDGQHVTEKIKDQTATVGAKDQFNSNVSSMSFKFTIVPETSAIANN